MGDEPQERVIRLGVTGHRVLPDDPRLPAAVDRVVDGLAANGALTLYSALAEGADRLVARAVLKTPGGRLIAVLPLSEDDYRRDFDTPASQNQFSTLLRAAAETIVLDTAESRTAAYQAGGWYVADHCDVLVTLWNGQPARGQGGTAEIVAYARARLIPLIWIATEAPYTVTVERLPLDLTPPSPLPLHGSG